MRLHISISLNKTPFDLHIQSAHKAKGSHETFAPLLNPLYDRTINRKREGPRRPCGQRNILGKQCAREIRFNTALREGGERPDIRHGYGTYSSLSSHSRSFMLSISNFFYPLSHSWRTSCGNICRRQIY